MSKTPMMNARMAATGTTTPMTIFVVFALLLCERLLCEGVADDGGRVPLNFEPLGTIKLITRASADVFGLPVVVVSVMV